MKWKLTSSRCGVPKDISKISWMWRNKTIENRFYVLLSAMLDIELVTVLFQRPLSNVIPDP